MICFEYAFPHVCIKCFFPVKSFAFSIGNKHLQPDELVIGQNGFTYKVDHGWAKINPANHPVINCHEMVQDSKGRLIMLGDDIHNNILVFD